MKYVIHYHVILIIYNYPLTFKSVLLYNILQLKRTPQSNTISAWYFKLGSTTIDEEPTTIHAKFITIIRAIVL